MDTWVPSSTPSRTEQLVGQLLQHRSGGAADGDLLASQVTEAGQRHAEVIATVLAGPGVGHEIQRDHRLQHREGCALGQPGGLGDLGNAAALLRCGRQFLENAKSMRHAAHGVPLAG
jgi:hypothetical protein